MNILKSLTLFQVLPFTKQNKTITFRLEIDTISEERDKIFGQIVSTINGDNLKNSSEDIPDHLLVFFQRSSLFILFLFIENCKSSN